MSTAAATTAAPVKRLSRIGKRPVALPKGVTATVAAGKIDVKGPKGQLSLVLPEQVTCTQTGDRLVIESSAVGRDAARLQGLSRALLLCNVKGVTEGYERVLELVGTGYRCEVKGRAVHLNLGYSHPCVHELPTGVSATVPPDSKGTMLILTAADKAVLGQTAATIRALRPPEPYGGKGIRYRGEAIRRKAGKAAKGKTK
jgi:large subunit ribosomal protein L6